ncbi:MAG: hypothetical protein K8S97_07420, partial [Anaerolineae bacterium]|nr:hypothetical protein [Anaerolineae bacterium]
MPQRRFILPVLVALTLLSAVLIAPHHAARATDNLCLDTPYGPGCTAGLPTVQYQLLLDEMLLHPEPNVRPLAANMDEIARFAFRRIVGGTATIYDAPGGNAVGAIDDGFNYVSVSGQQGDWI